MNDNSPETERLILSLEKKLAVQQARADSLQRTLERTVNERECVTIELQEERHAHQETKRNYVVVKRERDEICKQYDSLVAELSHLDERYKNLLRKEYGTSSERIVVLGEMFSEALDALAEEGTAPAEHTHSDADSRWVDPIDEVRDEGGKA